MLTLSLAQKKEFAERLITWYEKNGRNFPWRHESDRYRILVTEILLQRTRAENVHKIYDKFFSLYPNVGSLSRAGQELTELISKLGLTYRSNRLRELAKQLVEKYGGTIPCDLNSLLMLKGVGLYVASAVISFTCCSPTPVVDLNVMRVLNRHVGITRESEARNFISEIMRYADHRKISYALIDLGALACLDSRCECPLADISNFCLKPESWVMFRKIITKNGKIVLREQPISKNKRWSI
jgi:A/G-specific adenine glycosylase